MRKQFGGRPAKADLLRYATSSQWDGSKFLNLEETALSIGFQHLPKLLYRQFCEKKDREPLRKLPIQPFRREDFLSDTAHMKFTWYGHSVLMLRMKGKTLLIDPMLGPNAAPIAPFEVKRFSEGTLDLIDDFPEIDLMLMTHDHYDHLDLESIFRLKKKVKRYFVALGVGRHLVKWGVDKDLVTEFDWWQQQRLDDILVTFTPTRHFSGRGITDRAKSLWGGWTLKTDTENIWFSGDGGYGRHFKTIGERLGPFDFAFMECGQYNALWHQIHMFPEESVQAAIDVDARRIMPVHWAGFALAQHSWTDPVERFIAESIKQDISFVVPAKGQMVSTNDSFVTDYWWR